ncbi:hypothetical protein C8F01DRAFT_1229624 [Mycena amicta]|nr:hypothetical protein C8F01DRAFT_1229624 [Mycena amicta]
MTSNWAVFVTAPRVSIKDLNRALLLLLDFDLSEYHTDPLNHSWVLLTSSQLPAPDVHGRLKPTSLPLHTSSPPFSDAEPAVLSTTNNAFASLSMSSIRTFVTSSDQLLRAHNLSPGQYLIIDQRGLESSTALVCKIYQCTAFDEYEEIHYEDDVEGVACRMPYENVNSMMANLEIGNMEFEAFVDRDAGMQDDGSWRWASFPPSGDVERAMRMESGEHALRQRTLKEWRDTGTLPRSQTSINKKRFFSSPAMTTPNPFDFPDKYTHRTEWNAHIDDVLYAKYYAPGADPAKWNREHPDDEALRLALDQPACILQSDTVLKRLHFATRGLLELMDYSFKRGFEASWERLTRARRGELILEGIARAAGEAQRTRIRLYTPEICVAGLAGDNPTRWDSLMDQFKKVQKTGNAGCNVHMQGVPPEASPEYEAEWPGDFHQRKSLAPGLLMFHRCLFILNTLEFTLRAFFGEPPRIYDLLQEAAVRARYDVHFCQYSECLAAGAKNVCSKCHRATYCNRVCQKNAWPEHKKSCGKKTRGSFMSISSRAPKDEDVVERSKGKP